MKKLSFGLLFSALALCIGAFANNGNQKSIAVEAGAGTPASTKTIYIAADDAVNFDEGDADCGLYLFKDKVKGEFLNANRIGKWLFSATIPTNDVYDQFIILRTNPNENLISEEWDAVYNQTADLDFPTDHDLYRLTGWTGNPSKLACDTPEYSTVHEDGQVFHVEHGTRYYFDSVYYHSWWKDASHQTYLVSYINDGKKGYYEIWERWFEMTAIADTDLFYVDIPYGVMVSGWIVVRSTSAYNWGGKSHQSANILDVSDSICITGWNGEGDWSGSTFSYGFDGTTTNDQRLVNLFASCFKGLDLCLDAGGLSETFATNWAKAKEYYDSISALLVNPNAIKNANNDAMERYDAIISKNPSVNNFMDRSVSSVSNNQERSTLLFGSDRSNNALLITIVAVSAALAAGGFFFLRRRKEN